MNGSELRRLRLAAGLTQRGLADQIGISASLISQYEKGVPIPHYTQVKLRSAFGMPEKEEGRKWVPILRTSSGVRFGYYEK